jgi:hypothetical protein
VCYYVTLGPAALVEEVVLGMIAAPVSLAVPIPRDQGLRTRVEAAQEAQVARAVLSDLMEPTMEVRGSITDLPRAT